MSKPTMRIEKLIEDFERREKRARASARTYARDDDEVGEAAQTARAMAWERAANELRRLIRVAR